MCHSLQFKFAGIGHHRREESAAFTDIIYHTLVVHQSAAQQDGVHFPLQRHCHRADILGDLIQHGIPHQLRVSVAISDAAAHLSAVGCSQMAYQSTRFGANLPHILAGRAALLQLLQ